MSQPQKLFRLSQLVIQRYRMHGCPANPRSQAHGAWHDWRTEVAEVAEARGLGRWAHERASWYRLMTCCSAKGLDNLMMVLLKERY